MPLDADVMKATLKGLLLELSDSAAIDNAGLDAFCTAFAVAIVQHIRDNAVVTLNPLGLVSPSGAVTGVATGTIT